MRYTRIKKKEAFERFSKGEVIYLVPCKMYPGGFWNVACPIQLTNDLKDHAMRYKQDYDNNTRYAHLWHGTIEKTAWELIYNNWAYYNTNYEMGYYAHYYLKGESENED
jgi:hypothetical protein